MILIINLCKHELHYYEFVKPIVDIIENKGLTYDIKHIKDLKEKHINSSSKIIICGTSMRDHDYLKQDYGWIKNYNKPLLGICAGMQMICLSYGCRLANGEEIGLVNIDFSKEFLGTKGTIQAYSLHNNIIVDDAYLRNNFQILGVSQYISAIKSRGKRIYATLFHPEARNRHIIENFLYL